MAYRIALYCTSGGLSAAEGLEAILTAAREQGADLALSERASGESWMSGVLGLGGARGDGGCHVEVHAQSPLAAAMVAEVSDREPSGRIRSADAVVTLTLSGTEVDWKVVRAVWIATRSMWTVVPHDDGSGFDVDLDELVAPLS
ncbi:hypothetical protein [Amycolatopsis thermoflava]|uniref:hypothetical protein n=1 Tax=Amycolatopsis thermoflava TaxID=84480 RepID=UPI003EBDDCF8